MEYFPIFMNLKSQPVLVVGGAESARNKLQLLLKAGALVTWVAEEIEFQVDSLENPNLNRLKTPFEASHLEGKKLVYVASDDPNLAAEVSQLANQKNLPVNVVDNTELCSFITPSLVDRSPLMIAVSSSGVCPRLSRLVRAKLETLLPQSYSRLADLLGEFRLVARKTLGSIDSRRRFWDKLFNSPVIEMFLSGQEKLAEKTMVHALETHHLNPNPKGEVCLVGAGPGDPDLLTLRALRLIQNADVIVYDRLVSPKILDYARREAEKIYVGKKASEHTLPQDQINETLVRLAQEGKLVVRLKGGDPFIFGRGGEELEELVAMGIDFQVVPGVTAASGCGVYAGIPLTHRDYAQSVRFVTGHMQQDGSLNLDWKSLASPNQTLVFYMGLATLETISTNLTNHGMPASTPVALIEKGTTYQQRVVISYLAQIGEVVARESMVPPTLVIVGEVVGLASKLKWFDPNKFESSVETPFQQP